MFWFRAHLPKSLFCAIALEAFACKPAFGCGAMRDTATLRETGYGFDLVLADGRKIRLAGVDIPDASAAKARLEANWFGKTLGLAILSPLPDRWGRWLADVEKSPEGVALSDDLLDAGLARVKPEYETRTCEAEWLARENRARTASLGIWNDPDAIHDASDIADLARADARLVVVEGTVRRIGRTRARVYLDFGGRGGFTVVVQRRAEATFRRFGIDLAALAGKKVRVRGYLDDRLGARIENKVPAMIEQTEGVERSHSGG